MWTMLLRCFSALLIMWSRHVATIICCVDFFQMSCACHLGQLSSKWTVQYSYGSVRSQLFRPGGVSKLLAFILNAYYYTCKPFRHPPAQTIPLSAAKDIYNVLCKNSNVKKNFLYQAARGMVLPCIFASYITGRAVNCGKQTNWNRRN